MELILVTGMSGAGKSVAVNALEDVGFFCVDNIPASLAAKFVELCTGADSTFSRVAIVVDIRSREHHQELCSCFRELQQKETPYQLLFLDCDDSTIHHRYKETRRKHPLVKEGVSMEEALQTERQYLQEARLQADYVIDTSLLTASQLRDRIFTVFSGQSSTMMVSCLSFGFKHGLPPEADLVFDLRSLPNPFYQPELRDKTGLDQPVADYVLAFPQAQELLKKLRELCDFLLDMAQQEGRSQYTIAVGCTGGHHRSVVFAHQLGEWFRQAGRRVVVNHRDISR